MPKSILESPARMATGAVGVCEQGLPARSLHREAAIGGDLELHGLRAAVDGGQPEVAGRAHIIHCPAAEPWAKKKGFTVPVASWIAPRAGTDPALAQALCHVWITEGLYDKEFVAKRTTGFDELLEALREAGEPQDIAWLAERYIEILRKLAQTEEQE